jgi:hypothetical protein
MEIGFFMKELFKQRILEFHQTAIKPLKARALVLPVQLEKILVVTGMRRVGKS